MQWYITRMV